MSFIEIITYELLAEPTHSLLLSVGLGAIIGLERELAGKDPSLRTFSLISLGACIFSIISLESHNGFGGPDPSRVAAQIVSGVGFLGAGTIFRSKTGVSGLTTAALMWVTAGIGMAVGFNRHDLAISTTCIAVTIAVMFRAVHKVLKRFGLTTDRDEKPSVE